MENLRQSSIHLGGVVSVAILQHSKQVIELTDTNISASNLSFIFFCLLQLCCQKGFFCEICNNPKIIYPFEVKTTTQVRIVFY